MHITNLAIGNDDGYSTLHMSPLEPNANVAYESPNASDIPEHRNPETEADNSSGYTSLNETSSNVYDLPFPDYLTVTA